MATDTKIAAPGSYQQYKSDTATFLTWLLEAAQACGYKLPDGLKKSREATIKVAERDVPVCEITKQAKVVCTAAPKSASCRLPRSVARLAEQAIATRTAFTEAYETLAIGNSSSNDGHKHFTNVLQRALEILQEHAPEPAKRPSPAASQPGPVSNAIKLTNAFSELDVEDCTKPEDQLDADLEPTSENNADAVSSDEEDDKHPRPLGDFVDPEDVCMKVTCFFTDLRDICKQVLALWFDYKLGLRGLDVVAMTTNAAIALVDQMEKELLDDLFPVGGRLSPEDFSFAGVKSPYGALIGIAMKADSISMGKAREGLVVLDPATIFLSTNTFYQCDTALSLSKVSTALMVRKREKRTLKDCRAAQAAGKVAHSPWPRVETMEVAFLTMSMQRERVNEREFKKLDKNDQVITEIVLDYILRAEQLSLVANAQARTTCIDQAAVAFTNLAEGKVGAAAILSALIVGSMDLIFKDKQADIFAILRQYAEYGWNLVEHAQRQTMEDPTWLETDIVHVQALQQLHHVVVDPEQAWAIYQDWAIDRLELDIDETYLDPSDWKEKVCHLPLGMDAGPRFEKLFSLENYYMHFKKDALRLWTASPLACGTMAYNISIAIEQAGISLANFQLTIVCAAYLYVALKSRNLMRGRWDVMDMVISTHLDSIFFGKIPDDPSELHKFWSLRVGLHASQTKKIKSSATCAMGGDRSGKLPTTQALGSCLSTSDTAELCNQWFQGKTSMIKTVHALKTEMTHDGARTRKTKPKNTSIKILTFLQPFADFLAKEKQRMRIDYITFTRQCAMVLQALVHEAMEIRIDPSGSSPSLPLAQAFKYVNLSRGSNLRNNPALCLDVTGNLLTQDMVCFEPPGKLKKLMPAETWMESSPLPAVGNIMQQVLAANRLLDFDDVEDMTSTKQKMAADQVKVADKSKPTKRFQASVEDEVDEFEK